MLIKSHLSENILSSPTKLRVLTTLFKWRDSDLTERQLAKLCQLSTFGVRHALADLERSLMVTKKTIGRAHVWSLNLASFSFQTLKPIIEQLVTLPKPIEFIVEKLRVLAIPQVEKILLFGSILQEKEEIGDIDIGILMKKVAKADVIKENMKHRVNELSGELGPLIGKRLEPHVFTYEEWTKIKTTSLGKSILKGKEIYPHAEI